MDKNLFGAGNGNNGNGQMKENGGNKAPSSFAANGQNRPVGQNGNVGNLQQNRPVQNGASFSQRQSQPAGLQAQMQNRAQTFSGPNGAMGQNLQNRSPQMQNNPYRQNVNANVRGNFTNNNSQLPGQNIQGQNGFVRNQNVQGQNSNVRFPQGQMAQRQNQQGQFQQRQFSQGQNANLNVQGSREQGIGLNASVQGQNLQEKLVGQNVNGAVDKEKRDKAAVLLDGKKPKKKKLAIVISTVVACVLMLSLGLGILLGGRKKTYDIEFVTGPFEAVETKTCTEGDVFVAENLADVTSTKFDGSPLVLAKFEGWYLDEERTQPYSPFVVKEKVTLYAGYTLGDVTTRFYAQNDYDNDGSNLFLYEVTTKYWAEKIDLGEVAQKLVNLDCEYYDDTSVVAKISTTGQIEDGYSAISKVDYKNFIENYYELVSFGEENNRFSLNSQIDTPAGDSAIVANYSAKNIEIRLHTNKDSKNKYFASHGKTQVYEDEVVSVSKKYGTEYPLPTYRALAEYKEVTDKSDVENHNLVGWTTVNPIVENGEATNPLFGKDYVSISTGYGKITLSKEFLNNERSVDLYAVWEECATDLKIFANGIAGSDLVATGAVSNGYSQEVSKWIDASLLDREKDGYALVGLKTQDGTILEDGLNTLLIGGENSIGYDAKENAIVIYAYYKRLVKQTTIGLVDVGLDSDMASVVDLEVLKSAFEFNFDALEKDGFSYDTDKIGVSFDSSLRQIVITNLVEGVKFKLPTKDEILRERYNLVGFRYAGEVKEAGSEIEIASGNISGTNTVAIVSVWQGKQTEVKIGKMYSEDIQDWVYASIQVEYGTKLSMIQSTSKSGAETTISVGFYSNGQLVADKIEQSRKGYDFIGWEDEQGTEYSENELQNLTINSNFRGLFAKWQSYTYNITFILSGGNIDGNENPVSIDVEFNDEISLQRGQVKEGYSFDEWLCDGVSYKQDKITASSDMVFVAQWSKLKSVTLYVDATKNLQKSAKIYAEKDGNITINGSELSSVLAGSSFEYFNTSPDGSGISVKADSSPQIFANLFGAQEDVDLFAMWFNLSFDNGNVKGSEIYGVEGSSPAQRWIAYGANIVLPTKDEINMYSSKLVYQFDGWRVSVNGGAESKLETFVAGQDLEFSQNNIGKTISAVADWRLKDVKIRVLDSNDSQTFESTVAYDETNRKVSITTLPKKDSHELDYLYNERDGYAYFAVDDEFVVDVPQLQENYSAYFDIIGSGAKSEFVYVLKPTFKYTVSFYENVGENSKTFEVYVGAGHDQAIEGKIAQVDIEGTYTLTLQNADDYGFSCQHKTLKFWATDSSGITGESTGMTVEVVGDMVYYAIWVGAQITINYVDPEGQNSSQTMTVSYGDSFKFTADAYNKVDKSVTDESGAITGYLKFNSFVYEYGDNATTIALGNDITLLSRRSGGIFDDADLDDGVVTIKAHWIEKTYNLSIKLEGGAWEDAKAAASNSLSTYGFVVGESNTTLIKTVTYN